MPAAFGQKRGLPPPKFDRPKRVLHQRFALRIDLGPLLHALADALLHLRVTGTVVDLAILTGGAAAAQRAASAGGGVVIGLQHLSPILAVAMAGQAGFAGAFILVARFVVAELSAGKQPRFLHGVALPGHVRFDARLFSGFEIRQRVVAAVGHDGELLHAQMLFGLLRHGVELAEVYLLFQLPAQQVELP